MPMCYRIKLNSHMSFSLKSVKITETLVYYTKRQTFCWQKPFKFSFLVSHSLPYLRAFQLPATCERCLFCRTAASWGSPPNSVHIVSLTTSLLRSLLCHLLMLCGFAQFSCWPVTQIFIYA